MTTINAHVALSSDIELAKGNLEQPRMRELAFESKQDLLQQLRPFTARMKQTRGGPFLYVRELDISLKATPERIADIIWNQLKPPLVTF